MIGQGSVSIRAISRLRIADICNPGPFAAIVPATPENGTCVVDTGRPYMSVAAMVAEAPCAPAARQRRRAGQGRPGAGPGA